MACGCAGGGCAGRPCWGAGCRLEGALAFAVVEEPLSGALNRVHLVAGRVQDAPRPDRREIAEAALFAPHALPTPLSAALEVNLGAWIAAARAALDAAVDE